MHFVFPSDPLNHRMPDDLFSKQIEALKAIGFSTSLCSDEVISGTKRLPEIPPGTVVVYRGWMLNTEQYSHLVDAVVDAGATPLTSLTEYLAAHHLPNWYPLICEFTPETRVYPLTADMVHELEELGWDAFFFKDYVKSLKTSIGSVIREPSQIQQVLAEMQKYRGEIEGGICIRRVEDFMPESERRYFVFSGEPFAPDGDHELPEIVRICARRIPSKFFSIDVITRRDGILRVVEIGDGQVSDLVGWSPARFSQIWAKRPA